MAGEASMSLIMSKASIVFVVGFGITFVTLFCLIILITIQAGFFKRLNSNKKQAAAPAPVPAPAPVVAAPAVVMEDEAEIAAVIAAVMAMYDQSGNGLVVRQVRRVGSNTPAWNGAGRQEYINTRY